MAAYPGAIPSFGGFPLTLAGAATEHSARHAALEAEVVAMATAMGVNFADTLDRLPKGASVRRTLAAATTYTDSGPPVDIFTGSVAFRANRVYSSLARLQLSGGTPGMVWTCAIRNAIGGAVSQVVAATLDGSGAATVMLDEPLYVVASDFSTQRYVRLDAASAGQSVTASNWSTYIVFDHGRP
jgi:hypothetical protein